MSHFALLVVGDFSFLKRQPIEDSHYNWYWATHLIVSTDFVVFSKVQPETNRFSGSTTHQREKSGNSSEKATFSYWDKRQFWFSHIYSRRFRWWKLFSLGLLFLFLFRWMCPSAFIRCLLIRVTFREFENLFFFRLLPCINIGYQLNTLALIMFLKEWNALAKTISLLIFLLFIYMYHLYISLLTYRIISNTYNFHFVLSVINRTVLRLAIFQKCWLFINSVFETYSFSPFAKGVCQRAKSIK